MKFLKDRRGYSMTFWAVFFGFVMIPIMAFGIELGRYFYARAEIAKAADSAALAAAAEINQRVFESNGVLTSTSQTWENAQTFASLNNSYLANYGISAMVTEISIDSGRLSVLVQVSANLQRFFPSIVPAIIVSENGYAGIGAFTH